MSVVGGVKATLGRIDRDGRLTEADPQLLRMQERAGGALGQPLAVPPLAAIVRLAVRLQIPITRAMTAAVGDRDVNLLVRVKPTGDGCDVAISGWNEHSPLALNDVGRARDFARTRADWICETDAALRIVHLTGAVADAIGRPLDDLFELSRGARGETLVEIAARTAARFEDGGAVLRIDGGEPVRIDGLPLIDGVGRLAGYRLLVHRRAGPGDVENPAPAAINAFGERLSNALREPLAKIIANADSLSAREDGPLRRDYADYASDIAGAGRHLLALVDDLVDLQAIEDPDFRPANEPVDLTDLLRRAGGLLTVRDADKQVRIDMPEPGAVIGTADHRRALQILINLISNAIRHSPPGGTIWLRAAREGDLAVALVADMGDGIDPENHERMFERFERLDLADGSGTGLGLYIARRLARAMGGDLGVDSATGEGARFLLTLPAA